jgi:hypothetical protein
MVRANRKLAIFLSSGLEEKPQHRTSAPHRRPNGIDKMNPTNFGLISIVQSLSFDPDSCGV